LAALDQRLGLDEELTAARGVGERGAYAVYGLGVGLSNIDG
jgi:hypothetical protein